MKLRFRLGAPAATAAICLTLVMTGSAPASATAGFAIANYMPEPGTSSQAMCLSGPNTDNGYVTMRVCDGSGYQLWHWVGSQDAGGYSQIANGYNLCLGLANGSTTQGTDVVVVTCNAKHAAQWWASDTAYSCVRNAEYGDFYPVVNEETAMVLGVSGGHTYVNTNAIIWSWGDTCNSQFWFGGADFPLPLEPPHWSF